jgi:hypothetical protein
MTEAIGALSIAAMFVTVVICRTLLALAEIRTDRDEEKAS